LVIKDKRLYNTVTKEYEAIDGDGITFCYLNQIGEKCWASGVVEGYTCDRRIKLRGVGGLYAVAVGTKKVINNLATITDSDCEEEVEEVNEVDEDWEVILSA